MVQVNEKYYAWSPDEEIAETGECGGAVTSILKFLLEEGIVDAVLAVKKGADLYDGVPILITDPEEVIKAAGSLHCGTLNIAKPLSKYLDGAKDFKVAVTTKPCDAMTIVELMKRNQIDRDNVIMVGVNCGGTFPPVQAREMIEKFYELDPDEVVGEEITKGKLIIETKDQEKELSVDEIEDEGYGRRTNCRRCENNIPIMADIAMGNWGVIGSKAGEATFVEVFSDKGAEVLDKAIKAGALRVQDAESKGVEIREKTNNAMVNLAFKWQKRNFKEDDNALLSIDEYMDEFDRCIKCFGCREACPLCFCVKCSIESESNNWVGKGELPPSPMFHFVRMLHMVDSCTNCGQCEEVCPMEIPLARIFHGINVNIQKKFDYRPGYDLEAKPPLSVTDKEPSEE